MAHDTSNDTEPSEGSALAKLFGPEAGAKFLEGHWQDAPLAYHHAEERAPEIWRLADLQSLSDALNIAAPGTIFANLPDRDEEYNQIQIHAREDAAKAFACKMGISLEPEMGKVTELILWLRAIQRELGLSRKTYGRCNIYAIPDGGRTACHYDQNINIVCQISGEKTWELAPNASVANPTVRHTAGTPPDAATVAFATGALPAEMPSEGRQRFVLKRGSVLFVPRGYWHQTSAKGDSVSLNFTYDQLSWAQVLSTTLAERLMKDEKWRGVAYGLRMDGPLGERAREEFEALLKQSGLGLAGIGFDDLE